MRGIRALLAVCLCLWATACGGKTQGEVLTEYGDKFAKRSEQIALLVGTLPALGSVTENQGTLPLDPPLVYDKPSGNFNCDIIHMEQVTNPLKEIPFDLRLGRDFHKFLMWTHPDSYSRNSEDDARDLASQLDESLARRYLVLHRAVEVVLPEAIDHQTFKAGRVVYEGFVLDLVDNQVEASYRISATTYAEAGYSGGTLDSMIASVRSGMWTKARDQVVEALTEVTGGKVILD